MNEVAVEDDCLPINGNSITFTNSIREHLDFDDFVVVDLRLTAENPEFNRNIVAVNPDGCVRWRIDECPDVTSGGHDAYAGLFKEGTELWAYNLNGMKYKINTDNGSVIDGKFVK